MLYLFNTAASPAGAEPVEESYFDFEERFSLEHQAQPVFTRPAVQQLLSSLPASFEIAEAPAATDPPIPDQQAGGPVSSVERKSPAKVLKELVTAPVKELLVSRAEAGSEDPPKQSASSSSQQAAADVPRSRQPSPFRRRSLRPRWGLARARSRSNHGPVPPLRQPLTNRAGDNARSRAGPAGQEEPLARAVASTPDASRPGSENPSGQVATSQAIPSQAPAAPGSPSIAVPSPAEPARAQEEPARVAAATPRTSARPDAPERPRAARAEPQATAAVRVRRRIATGRATWYEHPGRTASGERFDPNQLTAAHHTLPFGTRVRVVHEGSGRSIAVRINDRIPRKTAVLIDLSRASARALGVDGVARVSLYQP
jgi:rare lipoprotein A